MEVLDIAHAIEAKIKAIDYVLKDLKKRSITFAETKRRYALSLAIITLKLKNEEPTNSLNGDRVINYGKLTSGALEILAKAICSKERLDKDVAEASYKIAISGLKALQSQLTGYQTIYKHLQNT